MPCSASDENTGKSAKPEKTPISWLAAVISAPAFSIAVFIELARAPRNGENSHVLTSRSERRDHQWGAGSALGGFPPACDIPHKTFLVLRDSGNGLQLGHGASVRCKASVNCGRVYVGGKLFALICRRGIH